MGKNISLQEQFLAHVSKGSNDICWLWIGSLRQNGYGQMRRLGKTLKAHRVSWELAYGKIPDGMVVCHKCDNPPCVNPNHLFLATQNENLADMRTKIRSKTPHFLGSKNPASKLTENQVLDLRLLAASGKSIRSLAKQFSLNKKTVSEIVKRHTWKNI